MEFVFTNKEKTLIKCHVIKKISDDVYAYVTAHKLIQAVFGNLLWVKNITREYPDILNIFVLRIPSPNEWNDSICDLKERIEKREIKGKILSATQFEIRQPNHIHSEVVRILKMTLDKELAKAKISKERLERAQSEFLEIETHILDVVIALDLSTEISPDVSGETWKQYAARKGDFDWVCGDITEEIRKDLLE